MRNAIVMAAGKGTRMQSETSKVMHPILGKPMLAYPVEAIKQAGAQRIVIVVGHQKQSIMDVFSEYEFAIQEPQNGTGHAVMQATMLEKEEGLTLVVNGDVPCIQPETLKALYRAAQESDGAILTSVVEDGAHYGRIIRDEQGHVAAIVEAKDCNEEQLKVNEINAGVYCFDNRSLFEGLKHLTSDNAQNEYYLTDLASIFHRQNKVLKAVQVQDKMEVSGVNDCVELAEATHWIQNLIHTRHMKKGVQICDPARTTIGPDVVIGHDVIIHPNTEITGSSQIGDYCQILTGSKLENCTLGQGVTTTYCDLKEIRIEDGKRIPAFTRQEDL